MSKICYVPKNFRADSLAMIVQANKIIGEYEAQGLRLTLRQRPSSTISTWHAD